MVREKRKKKSDQSTNHIESDICAGVNNCYVLQTGHIFISGRPCGACLFSPSRCIFAAACFCGHRQEISGKRANVTTSSSSSLPVNIRNKNSPKSQEEESDHTFFFLLYPSYPTLQTALLIVAS